MAFPYQCLTALGSDGILVASRGGGLYTFSADGSLLSSWQHPSTTKSAENGKRGLAEQEDGAAHKTGESGEQTSPPSKRRKTESESGQDAEGKAVASEVTEGTEQAAEAAEPEQDGIEGAKSNGQTKKGKKKAKPTVSRPITQEQPLVVLVRATSDGKHLVAVTGQDKTVWVFEHHDKGQLKELSQRQMPKRPSDIALTPDNTKILVADKFGDVYSIPLVPSPQGSDPLASTPLASRPAPPRKGANALTVHSARNLKALEDQKRQRENGGGDASKKEGPDFEHELLLGHVSMLTSIALASSPGGKPYILTGDRDEHIRVSRGMPQAHVIETYCLGHTSFVNALCLPQPDVLVSGGGDDELYVWDWLAGVSKSKVDLLGPVQGIVEDARKVAVSGIYAHDHDVVMVICERVPAIFIFKLSASRLELVETLTLSGNPLDLTVIPTPDKPARLVVSVDVNQPHAIAKSSLVTFNKNGDSWVPSSDFTPNEVDVAGGLESTRSELDKILYNVENLRKSDNEEGQEGGDAPTEELREAGPVAS
ncbi:uncharacterized protein BCR38DRAFT_350267 [Pseudomassariella vexata]|uniref:Uncharacterized protein n=1 Tax=Pseudomassariella vexata TaxID=1141098 RepID=A0A1Y2DM23_9PEZI|nr:uncharacterized protein BCR38DRAFT_350267 [Pseudomassariella vexata]ORY60189.1 hypothetical protein BCR38DRAFT_350267 [Pseudomassariella vexata]